jgi:tetratricopeptide (TPR) repeat protein
MTKRGRSVAQPRDLSRSSPAFGRRTGSVKNAVSQGNAGDGDGTAAVLSLPADEVLQRLDALRSRGQTWLANAGYRDLVQQLDRLVDPTPAELALRLGSSRRELETATEIEPVEERLDGFAESITTWFRQDHWSQRQAEIAEHYRWLIQTELRVGRRANALDLFQKARRLIKLTPDVQVSLARAAAELELKDLGAARLYLDFLRGPDQDGEMRRKVLGLLREAIRIDLVFPDEALLPEHRQLNEELWEFREEAWCVAHRAMGAWRTGHAEQAWKFRQSMSDLAEADVATLTQLGIVAYLCRVWNDAAMLLDRAEQTRRGTPGIERLYSSLTRVNQALAGHREGAAEGPPDDLWERELPTLLAFPDEGAEALDARWVRGAACALLGRDTEALDAFAGAPVQHLAWRYAVLEMESAVRADQQESWLARVCQRMEEQPGAAPVGRLLQAIRALERVTLVPSATSSGRSASSIRRIASPIPIPLRSASCCGRSWRSLRRNR